MNRIDHIVAAHDHLAAVPEWDDDDDEDLNRLADELEADVKNFLDEVVERSSLTDEQPDIEALFD